MAAYGYQIREEKKQKKEKKNTILLVKFYCDLKDVGGISEAIIKWIRQY